MISWKHTERGSAAKAIIISLGSLVGVHLAIIVTHMIVDAATPRSHIAYAVDRGLESIEDAVLAVRSPDAKVKTYLHQSAERMEELESELVPDGNTGTVLGTTVEPGVIVHLLQDCVAAVQRSARTVDDVVAQHKDIHAFALVLLHESTVTDLEMRMRKLRETNASGEVETALDDALKNIASSVAHSRDTVALFEISEEQKAAMREESEREVATWRRAPAASSAKSVAPMPASQSAPACAAKGEPCGSDGDCCAAGLVCTLATTSDGQQKICMPNTLYVCTVTCEVGEGQTRGLWANPTGCAMQQVTGIERCDDIVGTQCDTTEKPRRVRITCADS